MAVNAFDGENVERAFMTLISDTLEYQSKFNSDLVDPWSTPTLEEVCTYIHCVLSKSLQVG